MGTILRGGTSVTTGSTIATALIFPVPVSVVAGDIIMIWCASHAAAQSFSAASYTAAGSASTTNVSAQLIYKTAVSADSGSSVTVTKTGSSNSWGGYLCAYGSQGFDPTPSAGSASTGSTVIVAPGITTTHLGDTLVWLGMATTSIAGATPGTMAVPGGYTTRGLQTNSLNGTVGNIGVIWGDQSQSFPPGSTGNISGTDTNSNPNAGLLVGLQSFTAVTASTTLAVSGSASGAVVRLANKITGGAASTFGIIENTTNKTLTSPVSSSGSIKTLTSKSVAGQFSVSGALQRNVSKSIQSSVTASGVLRIITNKILAIQVSLLGVLSTIYRQFRVILLQAGAPLVRWRTSAGKSFGNWDTGSPTLRWIMSTANLSISQLSTEFVQIPVGVTINGSLYNPTADTVQFAFLTNPSAVPTSSNWVAGSWSNNNNAVYPYLAQCLVGTAGTVSLTAASYTIWLRVTDSPEIPVHQVGTLTIF